MRLARVLDEVEITGIQTTLPFQRFVAADPGFRAAELSTDWVAEHWDPEVAADRGAALEIAARVAVAVAAGGEASGTSGQASGARTSAGPKTRPSSPGAIERGDGSSGWLRAAREDDVDRWPQG